MKVSSGVAAPRAAAIDHVVWAVPDLAAAAAGLTRATGDMPSGGGVHPVWGTRNVIFAAGHSYLELITVQDPDTACETAFGRRVRDVAAQGGGLAMWAVRLPDLAAVADRLSLVPVAGTRLADDGQLLTWSTAGTEEAAVSGLPFFISWTQGLPPHALGRASLPATRLASLTTSDEPEQLRAWIGEALPGVGHTSGHGGLERVVLSTGLGEVHIPDDRGPGRPRAPST